VFLRPSAVLETKSKPPLIGLATAPASPSPTPYYYTS